MPNLTFLFGLFYPHLSANTLGSWTTMTGRNEAAPFGGSDKGALDNLQPYQSELIQLTELSGIKLSPVYVWIFVQLLNMKISPDAVYKLLKLMRRSALRNGGVSARTTGSRNSTKSPRQSE